MASNRKQLQCALMCLLLIKKKLVCKRKYTKKRYWVKTPLVNRPRFGLENNLLTDLLTVEGDFQNFTRLPYEGFLELHEKIKHAISKQETCMRSCISSKIRLAVTLRYLASGSSFKSLEFLSRVSRITIGNFVPEVCNAIVAILKEQYLKTPHTAEEWQNISSAFARKWQFPHVIGALDGKHISIKAPPNEGSYYYNYKGYHSVVLLALVDANYNFIYVDCGCNGRISDGGVYKNSSLFRAINIDKSLNIPEPTPLPGRKLNTPYCIIADDAFALNDNLMKPYPRAQRLSAKQKIFNYRLCRARRVVENAFGILASRFRIFMRPMDTNLQTTESIIMCCCILHNFLRPSETIRGDNDTLYDILPGITRTGSNFSSNRARKTREEFADYFVNEGNTNFQWDRI